MIIESPLDLIFRDLFYRLRAFAGGHDVFLKLEGFNITGSIKVKTAIELVEDLEQRGVARPNETVLVESSSGNLGLALSLVCAIKGYKFICVTDPNANRAAIRGIELYGAKVIVVEDRDPANGYLGSRLKKIDQILQSDPNAVWLNQYANVANKNVHAEQTANEIVSEFNKVDWVFVGTGTTGTLAGISERLRQEFPRVKVVAVEPVGSVTFGGAPGKRNIPGIGTSVRPKLADLAKPDRIIAVNEEKTVEACLSFVRDYHLLVGGSTGTVLAAVQQLAPEFKRGDTIVAISADLGEKYLDTIYDPTWVEQVIVPEDSRPGRTYARVAAECKDMPTDLSPPARVGELVDTISGKEYSESGAIGD
ncbi:MAG TPA: 2,3-diaminopropionate biosynthesis protein SbnA [Pyrinomonadaceae bacterium]|jgi:cysteine synthase A